MGSRLKVQEVEPNRIKTGAIPYHDTFTRAHFFTSAFWLFGTVFCVLCLYVKVGVKVGVCICKLPWVQIVVINIIGKRII